MVRIIDEIVQDKKGNVIATKEFINEIVSNGEYSECITREVIQLSDGRVVVDHILYRSKIEKNNNGQFINLLTGLTNQGE